MIGWERRVLLRHYLEQGMTKTELAERFGISRQTIYRWIRSGELDRDLSAAGVHYSARAPVATKLDRYRDILVSRLGEYPDLTAVRLFEEIKAAGYAGGYTQVKEYVRKVRPRAPEEPVVRFETPPGHQGQVDFADFRLPWGKRYAFLVVLGFSRVLWLQFFTRQTMLHVFEGLEAAFTFFGGVPRELLFDQMKAVVTKDERAAGGRVTENAEFLPLCASLGLPRPSVSSLPGEDQGQGRATGELRAFELLLWPNLHVGRGPERSGPPLARSRGQRPYAWHPEGAARRSLRARARPAAALGLAPIPILGTAARGDEAGQGCTSPYRRGTSAAGSVCPGGRRCSVKAAGSRRDRIRAQLADLKMPGALEAVDDVLTRVDGGGVTASEAIEQLLGAQIMLRNNRRLQAAMRSSRLPAIKTLDDFDFSFQPSIKREQIDSLHELGFLARNENVIFLGPPGVGKTHLAISLAIAAAQSGRRVYYGALADLITSLEEAKTAGQLGRRLKILTYPSLLVIDEIGYLPVSQTGAMLFFQLINRRYERASTVLTSNKGFEEWGQILGDEVMAAALIDRLLHHCHIVNIRGSSYRMRKHIDLSKILHSPPAEPTPLPPKRKRARAKEKSTN